MAEDGSLSQSALEADQGSASRTHAQRQFDGLEPVQDLLVKNATARAYAVKARSST